LLILKEVKSVLKPALVTWAWFEKHHNLDG